eukprot:g3206.t1
MSKVDLKKELIKWQTKLLQSEEDLCTDILNKDGKSRTKYDVEKLMEYLYKLIFFQKTFSRLDADFNELCRRIEYMTAKPQKKVIIQKTPGTKFYIILQGSVSVLIKDKDGADRTVNTMRKGEAFGGLALITGGLRAATIQTVEECKFLMVRKSDYLQYIAPHDIRRTKKYIRFLRQIPVFGSMNEKELQSFASILISRRFLHGDIIISEGDTANYMYYILSGRCRVLKRLWYNGEWKLVDLGILGPYDYFGEYGMLYRHSTTINTEKGNEEKRPKGLRTASVIAWGTTVEVLEVSRVDFHARFSDEMKQCFRRETEKYPKDWEIEALLNDSETWENAKTNIRASVLKLRSVGRAAGGDLGELEQLSAPLILQQSVTNSSLTLVWLPPPGNYHSQYEVQKRKTTETQWAEVALGDGFSTLQRDATRLGRFEVQEVETRADTTNPITTGYFTLSFTFSGLGIVDSETTGDTAEIPFNATAQQFKSILDAYVQLHFPGKSVHVIRSTPNAAGGHKWFVTFDPEIFRPFLSTSENYDMPLLVVNMIYFPGSVWTGTGRQVAVREIRSGLAPGEANVCNEEILEMSLLDAFPSATGETGAFNENIFVASAGTSHRALANFCTMKVTELDANTQYQFRIRAYYDVNPQFTKAQWGPWSEISSMVKTQFVGPPAKLSPPILSSATETSIALTFVPVGDEDLATAYEVSLRKRTPSGDVEDWKSAASYGAPSIVPSLSTSRNIRKVNDRNMDAFVATNVPNLLSNTEYEFRVRAQNSFGNGPWSVASLPMRTMASHILPQAPYNVVLESEDHDLKASWHASTDNGANIIGYEVEYKQLIGSAQWTLAPYSASQTWIPSHELPNPADQSGRLYETQVIQTRFNPNGTFVLAFIHDGANSLNTENSGRSSRIPFSADGPTMHAALESMSSIRPGGIRSVEHTSTADGSTWTIVFNGAQDHLQGSLPTLAVAATHFDDPMPDNRAIYIQKVNEGKPQGTIKSLLSHYVKSEYLRPSTYYLVRVRALSQPLTNIGTRKGIVYSVWSETSRHVRTAAAFRQLVSPGYDHKQGSTDFTNEKGIGAFSGGRLHPAHVSGTSCGGGIMTDGCPGFVVIRLFYENDFVEIGKPIQFFSSALEYQTFVIPEPRHKSSAQTMHYVEILAWGAGGAGGTSNHSYGGGGGFVRSYFSLKFLSRLKIVVGGGGFAPQGGQGGEGGFNRGGPGGSGEMGAGGGGGATEVWLVESEQEGDESLLLSAGGGGGGGATNYCCGHGGAGGGSIGENGASSIANTPRDNTAASIPSRSEFNDVRDTTGFPALHEHLDSGFAPQADYTQLSSPGSGGTPTSGGAGGSCGTYEYFLGSNLIVDSLGDFDSSKDSFAPSKMTNIATKGTQSSGGRGCSSKEAGGGGGGGFFGGGGGGGGVDGAGGGGGSGFVNSSFVYVPVDLMSKFLPDAIKAPLATRIFDTAVTITWEPPAHEPASEPYFYFIEQSVGPASQDFKKIATVTASRAGVRPATLSHHVTGLLPDTTYRFRIIASHVVIHSPGRASLPVLVTTAAPLQNTWIQKKQRSFTNANAHAGARITNPSTSTEEMLPSAARGHSLVTISGFLYLFGGFHGGYRCDDNTNGEHRLGLASYDSRKESDKPTSNFCRRNAGATNKLWRYDPLTSTWVQLTTTGSTIEPREMHSSVAIGSTREIMLVFGGHRGGSGNSISGRPISTNSGRGRTVQGDVLYNDVWELNPGRESSISISSGTLNKDIEERHKTRVSIMAQTTLNNNYDVDMCIVDVDVVVNIQHACTGDLTLTLLGPGHATLGTQDQTSKDRDHSRGYPSANNISPHDVASHKTPVQLFPGHNGTLLNTCGMGGLVNTRFDDEGESIYARENNSPFTGNFKPKDSLKVFDHLPADGKWSLELYSKRGSFKLHSWSLEIMVRPCHHFYRWRKLSPTGSVPAARYGHSAVQLGGDKMFIFGGQDVAGKYLNDLWRLDYNDASSGKLGRGVVGVAWRQLAPATYGPPVRYSTAAVISPWGVLAFGGRAQSRSSFVEFPNNVRYPRVPKPEQAAYNAGGHYLERRLFRFDLRKESWHTVETTGVPSLPLVAKHRGNLDHDIDYLPLMPSERYLGAMAYTGFDNSVSEKRGKKTPALLLWGGYNGVDYKDDMWELQCSKFENDHQVYEQRRDDECNWRTRTDSTAYASWSDSCGASSPSQPCSVNSILYMAWCTNEYQSIQNLNTQTAV